MVLVAAIPASAFGPSVVAGQPVQFVDRSIFGPESWSWDFDYDGAAPTFDSVEQNPVWTFEDTRVYRVYLEVCNAFGCGTRVQELQVLSPPPLFVDGFESGDLSSWSPASSSP
jgi:PKD repeat protein